MWRLASAFLVAGIALSAQQASACSSSSWRLHHKSFHVLRSSETPLAVVLGTGEAVSADVTVEVYMRPGELDVRLRNSGPFVDPGVLTKVTGGFWVVYRVAGAGSGTVAVDVLDAAGKLVRTISHAVKVEVKPFFRC